MGQLRDFEKFNALALLGWRVLQVAPRHVTDGTLRDLLAQWFSARRDEAR